MDAGDIFRQGLGSMMARPPPPRDFFPRKHLPTHRDDASEDGSSHRIAHTLTACCRCRQRKTRCDPTLPRCLPCERSGSTCEYFDTTKGKKINRNYVVRLQEQVRRLEAEIAQFTNEDEFPQSTEDMVRPGGLVRLNETDETPRYLGPSSGIAMTRLVMEEAKLYTDSKRISELIPEVRSRRQERQMRMQSVQLTSPPSASSRKKSYPMLSAHPAGVLPSRQIAAGLVDAFSKRAQYFAPALHEKVFAKELDEVYNGDEDPHKNFVVRMVLAIALQKLDPTYAGLADSYYLAAMQRFEQVVRPKDVKTLQCLILVGQYSLLTPTRTAVYYIIGLATRICQQLGFTDEKSITQGYDMGLIDPLTLEMRRRLSWAVMVMEYGLAHGMGRPSGFSKGDDFINVGFISTVDDKYITAEGILPAPDSEKKLVAIHFCKMRICQAEIRRVLYEKKRPEPRDEDHPWFAQMEQKIRDWLDETPTQPAWSKPWFTGRYHQMLVFLFRPSPQVPKPSSRAATRCYESAAYIINLGKQQIEQSAIDITWVFLLTLYMSINTLLWTISYAEVRGAHSKEDVDELVNMSLDIFDQCTERWPGTAAASQLYAVLAKACMQSYDAKQPPQLSTSTFNSPILRADTNSPPDSDTGTVASMPSNSSYSQQSSQQKSLFNPQFAYAFNEDLGQMNSSPFGHLSNPFQQPPHPTFRSNSIFAAPSQDSSGRRFSYFPPEFTHSGESTMDGATTERTSQHSQPSPPENSIPSTHPTPPNSFGTTPPTYSPSGMSDMSDTTPTPKMPHASPVSLPGGLVPHPINRQPSPGAPPHNPHQPPSPNHQRLSPVASHTQQSRSAPAFTIPPPPQHHAPQQRSLPAPPPTTVTDWFNPPAPFINPYTFSGMSAMSGGGGGGGPNGLWEQADGLGAQAFAGAAGLDPAYGWGTGGVMGRHGSLSHSQQDELMKILETEGMGDIDAFLSMDMSMSNGGGLPMTNGGAPHQGVQSQGVQGQGQAQSGGGGVRWNPPSYK